MSGRTRRQARSVLIAHPSAELYGSDRVLLETVQGLAEHGVDVTVTLPSDGPLVGEIRARGGVVELCPAPVVRKSALRPAGALRLMFDLIRGTPSSIRLIRRLDPDVVLVSTLTIPSWLILARLMRRRVICHVHEGERSAPAIVRRVLAAPLLLADAVLVNSQFSLDVLTASFRSLENKATILYNGIPGPDVARPARPDLAGSVGLIYVGRISPRKGPDVALDGLSLLVARGTDARLNLIGSVFKGYEWFSAELRAKVAADPHLRSRVTFHGFIADVWPHLADSDIVLVPSRADEPFGNTAVEAMLAARPAIVSATSGLLEAASGYQSVISVEPGDPAALAGAVDVVLADWPRFSEAAVQDSMLARHRHAPARYRTEVARLVAGVAVHETPVPSGPPDTGWENEAPP